jgi:hypothetical protein
MANYTTIPIFHHTLPEALAIEIADRVARSLNPEGDPQGERLLTSMMMHLDAGNEEIYDRPALDAFIQRCFGREKWRFGEPTQRGANDLVVPLSTGTVAFTLDDIKTVITAIRDAPQPVRAAAGSVFEESGGLARLVMASSEPAPTGGAP